MERYYAIRKVNAHLGEPLLKGSGRNSNTHFSNKINKSAEQKVWWFNILPQRFGNDLHLLCAKEPGLIWLRIKANTFPNPESVFRLRSDKGSIDLEIAADGDRYLKDLKSGGAGYDFRPHIEYEWDED